MLFLILPLALATSFIQRPLQEVVLETPVVVRGQVGMSYTDWVVMKDGTKRIYTFYELQVSEVFKGTLDQDKKTITFREIGGEKDGVGLEVSGAAKFHKGEDVVVLLGQKNTDESHDVQSMMMGKYIVRLEGGSEYLVGPGVSLQHEHVETHKATEQKITLENLRTWVKPKEAHSQQFTNSKTSNLSLQSPTKESSLSKDLNTPESVSSREKPKMTKWLWGLGLVIGIFLTLKKIFFRK